MGLTASSTELDFLGSSTSGMIRRRSSNKGLKSHCFVGISLGGGKNDRTCVSVLEYYPEHQKIFLSRLYEKISNQKGVSADEGLFTLLDSLEKPIDKIAFDVPLTLPKCIPCRLKCPGIEKCKVSEVVWMQKQFAKRAKKKKRPNRLFTPYTQRGVEMYLEDEFEEKFHPSHALGSNAAPLTARAQYLQRRLRLPVVEAYPRLSIWRLGLAMKVPKTHLRNYKNMIDGEVSREVFLKALVEKNIAFVYQQDIRAMIAKNSSFEAFIVGLTAYLGFRGQNEKRPKGFPRASAWIEFPKSEFSW